MAQFKCKMCGGTIELSGSETVGTCEYCGTQQTLPKLEDDRRANLYDRANHFRRSNEFDKAMGMYERILNEDTTDAEAYWSLVLCRFGIEYVEDPATHKRIPTVNRAQYTSIFDDDNYKSALEYADGYQRHIYEEEARAINEIQKGILAISQKEEPFDVFICYKETDRNGRRTPDSVLANDLYHQLTQEGFKVFFSRITLEDKLGVAYEPYIFAALNSAKVMVVVGTKPEYFNAVWVKNEWSRYLSLIRGGAKKVLIPAYRDMDPYDLPEEFSHLQAQDMSKLGFMQDLIRGIKKLAKAEEPKATTVVKETVITGTAAGSTAPLLKRAFMFLEDGDWDSADEYCEKVLDIEPECTQAYLAKLMAELQVSKQEDLRDQEEPFDEYNNYLKAIRFADAALKAELEGYIDYINDRNEKERLENAYNYSKHLMNNAKREDAYKKAARSFETIPDYKDSAVLAQECYQLAEEARKDAILAEGKAKMEEYTISDFEAAIALLQTISGWKDADEKCYECQKEIEELKAAEEADRLERERKAEADRLERERKAEADRLEEEKKAKRNKKIKIIVSSAAGVVAVIVLLVILVIIPSGKYKDAMALFNAGRYEEATFAFDNVGSWYKDSVEMMKESIYQNAAKMIADKDFVSAIELLKTCEAYKDYKDLDAMYTDARYQYAYVLFEQGSYEDARIMFDSCDDYLFAKDMSIIADSRDEVFGDWYSKDYFKAYRQVKSVSAEFQKENQEFYENQYAEFAYMYAKFSGDDEHILSLQSAINLLKTIKNPNQEVTELISQYEWTLECIGTYHFVLDLGRYGTETYVLNIEKFYLREGSMYANITYYDGGGKEDFDPLKVTYSEDGQFLTIRGLAHYRSGDRETFEFHVSPEVAHKTEPSSLYDGYKVD